MTYIILDLECTVAETGANPEERKIIKITAVKLDESLATISEYGRWVSSTDTLVQVFPAFLAWIGEGSFRVATWGDHDLKQIKMECKHLSLALPKRFVKNPIDLRTHFADKKHTRPCGLNQALQMMNIPSSATRHQGMEDARNMAVMLKRLGG